MIEMKAASAPSLIALEVYKSLGKNCMDPLNQSHGRNLRCSKLALPLVFAGGAHARHLNVRLPGISHGTPMCPELVNPFTFPLPLPINAREVLAHGYIEMARNVKYHCTYICVSIGSRCKTQPFLTAGPVN